jgi:hypothetical protein
LGGQDGVGLHREVGRLVLRPRRPESVGGWESAGHYQDSIKGCVSRSLGQAPTRFVYVLDYLSLFDEQQGAIHDTAMMQ